MVYVEAVHMQAGGHAHEYIESVRWRDPSTGKTDQSTRAQMVTWIRDEHGVAKVTDGHRTVEVGVVNARPPYIRTHADGVPTDNLLELPRY